MQTDGNYNQRANLDADGTEPQREPDLEQLDSPPAPLDVRVEHVDDEADWVSYPAFYPHVVRLLTDEPDTLYGMRMRGADGRLTLLHGPEQDLEEVRRQVEIRWLYFLDACLTTPGYGEEAAAADLHQHLRAMARRACPVPPPGARSPFQVIDIRQIDQADLNRYPVGYPFVVHSTDDGTPYPTTAMMRTANLRFETFEKITTFIGPGENVIRWNLTLEVPDIEHAHWATVRAVNDFHNRHCESRGIKPATCPKAERQVAPYC